MTSSRPLPRPSDSLWPREHGAYIELLAPMLTALLFSRPTLASAAFASFACLAFVAHEPLLALLGRRGPRRAREQGTAARERLTVLSVGGGVALLAALWLAEPTARGALAVCAVLLMLAAVVVAAAQERTLIGQLVLASALTTLSLPVLVSGRVDPTHAGSLVALWIAIHVLATLTARAFVYRKRDGERLLGWATGAALLTMGALAILSGTHLLPLVWCLSPAPFALITIALSLGMFRPRTPRPLGLSLAFASVVSCGLLGWGLVSLV